MTHFFSGAFFQVGGIIISGLILWVGCAHIEPPPGGPKDETSPAIVAVYPAPNATRQPRDLKAIIEFSKWVKDDFSAQDKITISPALPKKLQFEVQGNRVEVSCGSRLDSGVTYVLSVSPNVSGLNGQKLPRRFDIKFSTGPDLDSATLQGVVQHKEQKPGIRVVGLFPTGNRRLSMAYLKNRKTGKIDSLPRPGYERPMYLFSTDSTGRFLYSGIQPGSYGLMAFDDVNKNQRPDFGSEWVGIGAPAYNPKKTEPVVLTLAPYDTTKPGLLSARWQTYSLSADVSSKKVTGFIQLKFNKPMNDANFATEPGFIIISNDSLDTIPVTGTYFNKEQPESMELLTPPLFTDTLYRVICTGVTDVFGNSLDTAKDWQYLKTGGKLDSTKARVTAKQIKNGDSLILLNEAVQFTYSHILTQNILDSVGRSLQCNIDTQKTTFSWNFIDHHTFSLSIPVPSSYRGQWISISTPPLKTMSKADTSSITKKTFKKGRKPVKPKSEMKRPTLLKFRLINGGSFSKCDIRQKGRRSYWLVAFNPVHKGKPIVRSVPASMRITLDSLPQGKYTVSAVRDDNRNGKWDAGRIKPWSSQEPLYQIPDTLTLEPKVFSEIILTWPPEQALSKP